MLLVDTVYDSIRDDICSSRYHANELIVEQDIARKYNVSKGTASEALHRLCMEGHLKSLPRKGYMVTMLTNEDIRQIQRLRIPIESLAYSILVAQASDEQLQAFFPLLESMPEQDGEYTTINARFHIELAKLTNDAFIVNTLCTLLGALTKTAYYYRVGQTYSGQEYHIGILESLLRRDHAAAVEYLKKDLLR